MSLFKKNTLEAVIHIANSNSIYRIEAIEELKQRKVEFLSLIDKYKNAMKEKSNPKGLERVKHFQDTVNKITEQLFNPNELERRQICQSR